MDLTFFENLRSKLGLSPLGKPALIGLTALLVMVAVMAGRYAIDTATATEIQLDHENPAMESGESTDETVGGDEKDNAEETVFVHVSGAVAKPGLVELSSGSRVADAIEAAGGAADDASLEALNLARKVQDGEHVHLPSTLEISQSQQTATQPSDVPSVSDVSGKVNLNTASAEELQTLPGIGPSIAQRIVADRDSSGPFSAPEDLKRVSGIGEKKFAALEEFICV